MSYDVLDVGCGYGRNSLYIAGLGYKVISSDYYEKVFINKWYEEQPNITNMLLDCTKSLPFKENTFSAVVVIHFYSDDLFKRLSPLVAPNGYIFYESIGGHGDNWQQLDLCGKVKDSLAENFTLLYYKENLVGPDKRYATVKMVAKKIATS